MYCSTTASITGAAGGGALSGVLGGSALVMSGIQIGWIIVAVATLLMAFAALLRIVPMRQQ